MPQFTWTYDAPSGTFKNHALSARLYESAVEDSVFMEHVTPIDAFGKGKGETVTWTRLSNIAEPTSIDLIEGVRIPEDEYSFSTTSLTVGEIGRSVPYTNLAQDLGTFDLSSKIQSSLRNQMRLGLDTKVATAAKTVNLKYVPTGANTYTLETGSATVSATATYNMTTSHLDNIYDEFYDTYHVPPYVGDDYMGIFRWKSMRGIIDDPSWEEWHKYTDPSAKFNAEVGRWSNIRMARTNHDRALTKLGTNDVLGEGVIFGEDFLVMAEAEPPHLLAKQGSEDFGRSRAVAWYGILAFGLVWPSTSNTNEVRGIHIGSGA